MTSAEGYGLILVSDSAERTPARAVTAEAASPGVARAVHPEELVVTYSSLLFRVAHAVLRNRAEAEDTVQDAFLRVLGQRTRLSEIQDMRVWLVRIVWRLALDRKARIKPGQMDDTFAQSLVAHHMPADRALAESRELQRVLLEIDRLPAVERHVLLLCAVDEMKTSDVASVVGKSESAVRALLFRARERLKQRLVKQAERNRP